MFTKRAFLRWKNEDKYHLFLFQVRGVDYTTEETQEENERTFESENFQETHLEDPDLVEDEREEKKETDFQKQIVDSTKEGAVERESGCFQCSCSRFSRSRSVSCLYIN